MLGLYLPISVRHPGDAPLSEAGRPPGEPSGADFACVSSSVQAGAANEEVIDETLRPTGHHQMSRKRARDDHRPHNGQPKLTTPSGYASPTCRSPGQDSPQTQCNPRHGH